MGFSRPRRTPSEGSETAVSAFASEPRIAYPWRTLGGGEKRLFSGLFRASKTSPIAVHIDLKTSGERTEALWTTHDLSTSISTPCSGLRMRVEKSPFADGLSTSEVRASTALGALATTAER